MGKSILEERGRIIISKELREQLDLKSGQEVTFENFFLKSADDSIDSAKALFELSTNPEKTGIFWFYQKFLESFVRLLLFPAHQNIA